jgi:hypothetical protein
MPIQVDATELYCSFCKMLSNQSSVVRSMNGLYCSNEHCYTRATSGNLVPPIICAKCKENSFYFEKNGTIETGIYQCIACGFEEEV